MYKISTHQHSLPGRSSLHLRANKWQVGTLQYLGMYDPLTPNRSLAFASFVSSAGHCWFLIGRVFCEQCKESKTKRFAIWLPLWMSPIFH